MTDRGIPKILDQKPQTNKKNQLTEYLSPRIRFLLEKLTGSQLVNKFLAVYGARRFIIAITRARHLTILSQINPDYASYPMS
jgi:hypothetical protein